MRWIGVGVLGLGIGVLALSIPASLVGAMFTPHPVAGVIGSTMVVGSLALLFAIQCFLLMLVTPVAWLVAALVAVSFGRGAPAMRWVSPWVEPAPRRRQVGHHAVRLADWMNRASTPGSATFERLAKRYVAATALALVVAVIVHLARGIPFGDVDDLLSAGVAVICSAVIGGSARTRSELSSTPWSSGSCPRRASTSRRFETPKTRRVSRSSCGVVAGSKAWFAGRRAPS